MAPYLEQSLAKLEQFEGAIAWMYRDTVGRVTTAVGLMLPDAAAAERLPFSLGGRAATAAEIAQEFARVDALPMGRPAHFYRRPNQAEAVELSRPEIDALLLKVLTGFESELRTGIAGYDTLPDAVKLALLDMAYNLGPAKLLHSYTRLLKAVAGADWARAAELCFRRGPGAARNAWTRQQFVDTAHLLGVVKAVEAEMEGGLAAEVSAVGRLGRGAAEIGYGLLGASAALCGGVVRWFNTPR